MFYKITLQRSLIGLPQKSRSIVKSLGLGKRGSIAYQKISPSTAGAILRVKELVDVELTDKALTKAEVHDSRRSNPGFIIEKRVST
ncbi:hypothetical protein TBLA_0B02910 [Henningerozyma blattae CBS 6284]|uniref:Large ribosomal subunit protein uL30m n=1 Tax=Henningerozyma blattae (strain ATCC 34711 / CBS 6284 / DSM 70876 / NBRC 10599 / NRRL Y-10934 / UCD 77-7) TaxID=1071380 RepID=I2GYD1_HENB6|nr:hypothetical protein TBLA_0B02910 [Tetrapisispora blattae CBS 6284]CCH59133.1 hypothetical protein TBLA_0B02910 [Tetrapisispora blattae CBS 6284]